MSHNLIVDIQVEGAEFGVSNKNLTFFEYIVQVGGGNIIHWYSCFVFFAYFGPFGSRIPKNWKG